jgi:hypothetical protein
MVELIVGSPRTSATQSYRSQDIVVETAGPKISTEKNSLYMKTAAILGQQ